MVKEQYKLAIMLLAHLNSVFLEKFHNGVLYDSDTLNLIPILEHQIAQFEPWLEDNSFPIVQSARVDSLGYTTVEHNAITAIELNTALNNRPNYTAADGVVMTKLAQAGGLSPSLLTALIAGAKAEVPTGKLMIFSQAQTNALYAWHPEFKPAEEVI